jgi:hypothetical protein
VVLGGKTKRSLILTFLNPVLQLIIGISLGIILLFVIVLLVTEMAATYPVWKHFQHRSPAPGNDKGFQQEQRNGLHVLLLVMVCIIGFCIAGFLIGTAWPGKPPAPFTKAVSVNQPVKATGEKKLSDSLVSQHLFFTSETKWEDGKMYCNNQVFPENPQPLLFTELRYSFLDKDEFLIRELHFTPNDFVTEMNAYGGIAALLNRSSTGMSEKEYNRIEKLQVVLDKKRGGR